MVRGGWYQSTENHLADSGRFHRRDRDDSRGRLGGCRFHGGACRCAQPADFHRGLAGIGGVSMKPEIQKEIIKALAYGKTAAEIKTAMPGVTDAEISAIPQDVIDKRRASLVNAGYIR